MRPETPVPRGRGKALGPALRRETTRHSGRLAVTRPQSTAASPQLRGRRRRLSTMPIKTAYEDTAGAKLDGPWIAASTDWTAAGEQAGEPAGEPAGGSSCSSRRRPGECGTHHRTYCLARLHGSQASLLPTRRGRDAPPGSLAAAGRRCPGGPPHTRFIATGAIGEKVPSVKSTLRRDALPGSLAAAGRRCPASLREARRCLRAVAATLVPAGTSGEQAA